MAQVGNKVILYSSVLEESFFKAQFLNISPQKNPEKFQNIFNNILKTKIHNSVVLFVAEKDTTINVSPEEVGKNLDDRINHYIRELGSVQALEQQMGMTKGEIKTKHWKEVRDELLISAFQFKLLKDASVSRKEVFDFYETYKDSIPPSPPKASFSLIEKKVDYSLNSFDFEKKLQLLVDSLRIGLLDFDGVVNERSLSSSKQKTTSSRGDMFPEFDRAAFMLNVGEISPPIKTSFGFFIIKLFDRVGEKITTSHILLKQDMEKEFFSKTSNYLDSLVFNCKNDPGLFDSLSVSHRIDGENLSGFYEKIDLSFFPSFIVERVLLAENYSFSDVFFENNVGYVFYKYFNTEEQKSSLDEDWFLIESLALQKKKQTLFEKWIEEQYDYVYVKINPIY